MRCQSTEKPQINHVFLSSGFTSWNGTESGRQQGCKWDFFAARAEGPTAATGPERGTEPVLRGARGVRDASGGTPERRGPRDENTQNTARGGRVSRIDSERSSVANISIAHTFIITSNRNENKFAFISLMHHAWISINF